MIDVGDIIEVNVTNEQSWPDYSIMTKLAFEQKMGVNSNNPKGFSTAPSPMKLPYEPTMKDPDPMENTQKIKMVGFENFLRHENQSDEVIKDGKREVKLVRRTIQKDE